MSPAGARARLTVSRQAARRFLIRRTGLGLLPEEKPRWAGEDGVVQAVKALGYVQVDPMQVLAINQDLVLGARVDGYTPAALERALYRDRRLVEVLARNRYIVPAEDYPVFRVRFDDSERSNRPGLGELEPVMQSVLVRIEAEGPLSSLDFDDDRRVSGWWEPDGQSRTRAVRQALEWLWHFGRVGISHRAGARRYFDLPERLFGPEAARPPYEPQGGEAGPGRQHGRGQGNAESAGPLMRKYFRSVGLVDPRDWSFGWSKYPAAEKARIVEGLVAAEELARVSVEGVGTSYYVPAYELEELRAAAGAAPEPEVRILSPLDNLIWLRSRLVDLFEFDYTWEAYVPEGKRRYGPYTCPVLQGDSLVGRVDAYTDRRAGAVVLRGLWWEPGVPPLRAAELLPALERVAAAAGVERVADPDGLLPA
jgi:hypothetical protein